MQRATDKESNGADRRKSIFLYFFGALPQNKLTEKIKLLASIAQCQKLINVCLTRQVEGIDDMSIFEELLESVYHSPCEMEENKVCIFFY